MSTNQATSTKAAQTSQDPAVVYNIRRRKKAEGRKKRAQKLSTDKEFAKQYFESRSKRAADKKSAFRKKKTRKK
jgi:hypothetical protein